MRYKVAKVLFDIDGRCRSWDSISNRYAPFAIETTGGEPPLFAVSLKAGVVDADGYRLIYADKPEEEGFICSRLYSDSDSDEVRMITFLSPGEEEPSIALIMSDNRRSVEVIVSEDADAKTDWMIQSSLNSVMMLLFTLCTIGEGVLMTHSAAVVRDGKAWLFIGKSGTGKSTQARMWLKAFPGTYLLNDDHPVLRVEGDTVTVYGSPWSGKTHCYKNLSAPLAAVIRIVQAPHNKLQRLVPLQAYASIATSFSGMIWDERLAECRHGLLEKVVMNVGCFTLECLPEVESAFEAAKSTEM